MSIAEQRERAEREREREEREERERAERERKTVRDGERMYRLMKRIDLYV